MLKNQLLNTTGFLPVFLFWSSPARGRRGFTFPVLFIQMRKQLGWKSSSHVDMICDCWRGLTFWIFLHTADWRHAAQSVGLCVFLQELPWMPAERPGPWETSEGFQVIWSLGSLEWEESEVVTLSCTTQTRTHTHTPVNAGLTECHNCKTTNALIDIYCPKIKICAGCLLASVLEK